MQKIPNSRAVEACQQDRHDLK